MNELKVKELIDYDMKRVLSRVKKEFGEIKRGDEELYNPQLDYIEQAIYEIYTNIKISDYELQQVISAVIYDLKGYIENINYDYTNILDAKLIRYAKELEMLFNPFINENIKINEDAKKDLKALFTLPIICLNRIYESVEFWTKKYGSEGYFRMLEEMVINKRYIGKYPYALEEKYLEI